MYKAIIIGGGPGGYVTAIRLSKLGFKVAVIEKENLGGTCTNLGCIPTKALLTAAHFYDESLSKIKKFGINIENVSYDFSSILKHMEKSIKLSRKGVEFLLKKNNVDLYRDKGIIIDKNHVKLENDSKILEGENLILAQGSSPLIFPPFDQVEGLWTSDNVFKMDEPPQSILIIGGGVIGTEFSTFFSYLKKKVYLVELFEHILPAEDPDAASVVKKSLTKNGVSIYEKSKVTSIKNKNGGFVSTIETNDGKIEIESDKVILAVGRKANITQDIIDLGVERNKKGIVVNKQMKTNIDNVYAIGDITGEYMLAHVAMKEGIVAAENIAGIESKISYIAVPSIIFSHPEIASTGVKENSCDKEKVKIFKFPISANARASTLGERDGFVKAIKDKENDKLIGFTIVSPTATEMISQAVIAIELGLNMESVSKCIFPHPTLSESIMETFEGIEDKSIHI
jgi:dihydrolipoamide dehydrogenase